MDFSIKKVACVGILVADVMTAPAKDGYPIPGELKRVDAVTVHNGGNAMTASINLAKMGVQSSIIGKVGNDMFGTYLKDCLTRGGVDVKGLKTDYETQTSVSVVLLNGSGERAFLHCVGTNATFGIDDVDYSVIEESDLVFVTGTFLLDKFDGEQTVEFLKKCKEMGKTTFLDVCWDAKGRWATLVNDALPYIDYFMPSIDEAVRIAGGAEDPDEIADILIGRGANNIVIKLGGEGSYLRKTNEKRGTVYPAKRGVVAVDTTGAGDSFCSGFLAAYARGESPEECMRVANATGALCVTCKGATTATRSYEETIKFLNN